MEKFYNGDTDHNRTVSFHTCSSDCSSHIKIFRKLKLSEFAANEIMTDDYNGM